MKRHIAFSSIALVALINATMQAHADTPYPGDSTRTVNTQRELQAGAAYAQPQAFPNRNGTPAPDRKPSARQNTNPYDGFTGVYGGGELGYAFTDDLKGWNGGIFAGYGFVHEFEMLGGYLGAEAGYEWGGADGTTGNLPYEKDHAWNVSLRPGATIMEDGLGYAIIGYSRAEFDGNGGDEGLDGLILGVGGQFDTNTMFKTRLEYTWTGYEDGNINGTRLSPEENVIKLGAVLQF